MFEPKEDIQKEMFPLFFFEVKICNPYKCLKSGDILICLFLSSSHANSQFYTWNVLLFFMIIIL
jgi:hypothetical protein